MQKTRLNTLFDNTQTRLNQLFINPWRRISLSLMGLLFGFFVGQAVSTTAGQEAYWDITIAGFLIFFTETISRVAYSQIQQFKKKLWLEILNIFKIGFVYSLYFEALKLAS
ncbi:MAG: DUF565 domain-containing protein [cyanobacterium endosymbiont of Rhopalodia yunnanensis]